MTEHAAEPHASGPGEGLSVENPTGGVLTFKVMAEHSGGALSAIDSSVAPGEGPPLHVHRDEDEWIFIVDGAFRVKLGDAMVDAPAGSSVFIPRGIPHTWQNVGDAPGRFVATIMPAAKGFEEFFIRYAQLPRHERGAAAFARLGAETNALEVLGPSLAESDPI